MTLEELDKELTENVHKGLDNWYEYSDTAFREGRFAEIDALFPLADLDKYSTQLLCALQQSTYIAHSYLPNRRPFVDALYDYFILINRTDLIYRMSDWRGRKYYNE